jgi:hypothetical protein
MTDNELIKLITKNENTSELGEYWQKRYEKFLKLKHFIIHEKTINAIFSQTIIPNPITPFGHLDLTKFVSKNRSVDEVLLQNTVETAIRFLDSSLDIINFSPEALELVTAYRKIGVGVANFGQYLEMRGSTSEIDEIDYLGNIISSSCYRVSENLAEEKGVCNNWHLINRIIRPKIFEYWFDRNSGEVKNGLDINEEFTPQTISLSYYEIIPRRNSNILLYPQDIEWQIWADREDSINSIEQPQTFIPSTNNVNNTFEVDQKEENYYSSNNSKIELNENEKSNSTNNPLNTLIDQSRKKISQWFGVNGNGKEETQEINNEVNLEINNTDNIPTIIPDIPLESNFELPANLLEKVSESKIDLPQPNFEKTNSGIASLNLIDQKAVQNIPEETNPIASIANTTVFQNEFEKVNNTSTAPIMDKLGSNSKVFDNEESDQEKIQDKIILSLQSTIDKTNEIAISLHKDEIEKQEKETNENLEEKKSDTSRDQKTISSIPKSIFSPRQIVKIIDKESKSYNQIFQVEDIIFNSTTNLYQIKLNSDETILCKESDLISISLEDLERELASRPEVLVQAVILADDGSKVLIDGETKNLPQTPLKVGQNPESEMSAFLLQKYNLQSDFIEVSTINFEKGNLHIVYHVKLITLEQVKNLDWVILDKLQSNSAKQTLDKIIDKIRRWQNSAKQKADQIIEAKLKNEISTIETKLSLEYEQKIAKNKFILETESSKIRTEFESIIKNTQVELETTQKTLLATVSDYKKLVVEKDSLIEQLTKLEESSTKEIARLKEERDKAVQSIGIKTLNPITTLSPKSNQELTPFHNTRSNLFAPTLVPKPTIHNKPTFTQPSVVHNNTAQKVAIEIADKPVDEAVNILLKMKKVSSRY